MRKLLTGMINQVFPPRPSEIVVRDTSARTLSSLYSPGQFATHIYLSSYQSPVIQAAIVENKFHCNRLATSHLATLLTMWARNQILETLYLPIPLSRTRERKRGHNQVYSILQACDPKLAVDSRVLSRVIDTKPQTSLSQPERQTNMAGAFRFNITDIDLNQFQQIVLVDDVTTTGSTLREAQQVVASSVPSHLKITCLAIAH